MTKRTITSYFLPQKKGRGDEDIPVVEPNQPIIIDNEEVERNINNDNVDEQMPNEEGIGLDFLMRDPGLRKQIETYDSDEKDLIRRSYIDFGPYQPKLDNYPYSGSEKHPRRFQKSWEVPQIHTFFQQLIFVVNVVTSSSKRHDELQATQLAEIEHLVEIEGLETGKGLNQIGTLQRPGDTRWSSHYKSISSLLRMYCATRLVLANIASEGTTYAHRGDALNGVKLLMSFEFVFNIHVVKEIMAITDGLCQALQLKTQDIVNAMHLVFTTKTLLQTLRNDGWESLLHNVKVFCEKNGVTVPDMDSPYVDVLKSIRQQSRQKDNVTMEHHYRVDIFMAAIDRQLQELNARFSERATELLILSAALNPRDGYKSFNIEHIFKLARDFYPIDFTEHEKDHLSYELQHYWLDIPIHPVLKNLTTLGDLCQGLVTTEKIKDYPLVSRLIRLVLTLPASTATTERAFSAMKIVKTNLRSKMEDDFLKDYLIVYIEKEIAETLSEDAIIDAFYMMKERRAQLNDIR
uniref:HAT C-terminal dimerisation domain-containing protein n=1 Tax=Chenopodium quinoa TaxID=63459 RepID=A0A803KWZ5_CHEQI